MAKAQSISYQTDGFIADEWEDGESFINDYDAAKQWAGNFLVKAGKDDAVVKISKTIEVLTKSTKIHSALVK